jgi:HEAT repeat protein
MASEPLKQRLATATGNERVEVALALWRIERYPPAAKHLLDVLANASWWGDRMEAAITLRHVDSPPVRPALWRALDDKDELVRHHAAVSLLALDGLQEPTDADCNPCIGVMSDDATRRQAGKEALARFLGTSAAGQP